MHKKTVKDKLIESLRKRTVPSDWNCADSLAHKLPNYCTVHERLDSFISSMIIYVKYKRKTWTATATINDVFTKEEIEMSLSRNAMIKWLDECTTFENFYTMLKESGANSIPHGWMVRTRDYSGPTQYYVVSTLAEPLNPIYREDVHPPALVDVQEEEQKRLIKPDMIDWLKENVRSTIDYWDADCAHKTLPYPWKAVKSGQHEGHYVLVETEIVLPVIITRSDVFPPITDCAEPAYVETKKVSTHYEPIKNGTECVVHCPQDGWLKGLYVGKNPTNPDFDILFMDEEDNNNNHITEYYHEHVQTLEHHKNIQTEKLTKRLVEHNTPGVMFTTVFRNIAEALINGEIDLEEYK